MKKLIMYPVIKTTVNGDMVIHVGEHKIETSHSYSDCMVHAKRYIENELKQYVIGNDDNHIVASLTPTKLIDIYKFEQLSVDAKKRAINQLDIVYDEALDFFIEQTITPMLELLGFDASLTYFGSYVTLEGSFTKPDEVDENDGEYLDGFEEIIGLILQLPENFQLTDINIHDNETFTQIRQLLESLLLVILTDENEYQTSDDYIHECVIATNYDYDVDGKLLNS
jgi:hypothetical protein